MAIEDVEIGKILRKVPMSVKVTAVLIVVFVLLKPWAMVGAGERGVVLNFGAVQDKVLNEGLHFRIPVMQQIVVMDVKVQKAVTETIAASSDLQDVTSTLALNYHLCLLYTSPSPRDRTRSRMPSSA